MPNNNPSSSPEDNSSTLNPRSKPVEAVLAWAAAHQNDPPHREKIEQTSGNGPKIYKGPVRITAQNGVLTEYGKKVEQERLARLAATERNGGQKKVEPSSQTACCDQESRS
jgi:hypothetical protein